MVLANMRFSASIGGVSDQGGKAEPVDVRPALSPSASDLLAMLTAVGKEAKR